MSEINPVAAEAVKIADQHLAGQSIERRKALATDIAEAIVRHASLISKQVIDQLGKKKGRGWAPMDTAPKDGTVIDLWLEIHPSPMSMGMGDEFGVPDAWYANGKWMHTYYGKATALDTSYVMLWRSKNVMERPS